MSRWRRHELFCNCLQLRRVASASCVHSVTGCWRTRSLIQIEPAAQWIQSQHHSILFSHRLSLLFRLCSANAAAAVDRTLDSGFIDRTRESAWVRICVSLVCSLPISHSVPRFPFVAGTKRCHNIQLNFLHSPPTDSVTTAKTIAQYAWPSGTGKKSIVFSSHTLVRQNRCSVFASVRWSHTDFKDRALPLELTATFLFSLTFLSDASTACTLQRAVRKR